jgi:hypothetical protein
MFYQKGVPGLKVPDLRLFLRSRCLGSGIKLQLSFRKSGLPERLIWKLRAARCLAKSRKAGKTGKK